MLWDSVWVLTTLQHTLIQIINIVLLLKKDTTLVYLIPYLFSFWSRSPIDLLEPQNRLLLLGELHLELARARSQRWRSLPYQFVCMNMHDEHVDDTSGHTYTYTYTYLSCLYIHRYSDFLIWVIFVGLTSARPNYIFTCIYVHYSQVWREELSQEGGGGETM